jgi:branched-chain amino acid aminotransferase
MLDMTNFPHATKYWHQGKIHDWSEIIVHPMAHGLHYGTIVFEGIRAYPTAKGPAVFRLPEHNERFFYSAGVARMTPPYDPAQVTAAIKQTVRVNKLDSCYIRPLFYYAYGNMGLVPKSCPVELLVAAWEWKAYLGEKADAGTSVYILPQRRIHRSQVDMKAKLGGLYLLSTIGGMEARAEGCDEAVFLNIEDRVSEGPGQNIFVVKNGVVKTNDRAESILEGITRTSILEVAADLGMKTAIGPIAKEEFLGADEAFFTGTAVEVIPITKITDASDPKAGKKAHPVASGKTGPATSALRARFFEIVTGKAPRYEKWLTYVND